MPDALATGRYPGLRRILILVAVIFAIVSGYAQMAFDIGQTPSEFSADSDETLRVAGWAFSIWGVIYLGLLIYAVWQVWPRTRETPLLERMGWPSFAAAAGIGAWIWASAADWELATIILIVGSAVVLIAPLCSPELRASAGRERCLIGWPLGLLAGWLTIASSVNILTVLTGNGQLPEALSPTAWAIAALLMVAAITVAVTWRSRLLAYPIPVVWGLIGAFGAEQARNPTLAFTAIGLAIALAIISVVLVLRLRRAPG